jgi:polyphosphate kinase
MLNRLKALIDQEIAYARAGKKASMTIKVNNLEDKVMIDKLYEANQAGVNIYLIIRGICCLVPGVPGLSENIRVIRIVDQYLEHARIFIFHNDGDNLIYLSSADWMKRNLYRRVEVGFPVYHPTIKNEIKRLIELQLSDNIKACFLDQDSVNRYVTDTKNSKKVRSQQDFYYWLKKEKRYKVHHNEA